MRPIESTDHSEPITAVFVLDISNYTGPLLAGWLEAGNAIGAIIVPGFRRRPTGFSIGNFRRRLQRKLLLRRFIGNTPVKLIEFGRPYDWNALGRQLSDVRADVLVCYTLPVLIPQEVLGHFSKGGVNLHPALLPDYRGPHPIQRLAVDGRHAAHGGVTLHKMSAGFDEGDILGQVPFSEADWTSREALVDSTATAMRILVSEAVPTYCRGLLSGMPQPKGDFVWARLQPSHLIISPAMSVEHVVRLWHVLGLLPGIYFEIGTRKVRLGFQIRRLGPCTGKAPVRRWGTVEFDLANGRVLYFTYGRVLKRLLNSKHLFSRPPAGRPAPEIRLFGKASAADQKNG
ncbi:formyltransferase family protein [Mesorhizobium sp. M0011]|uniref:formyltransferase family protein n=1 Tax=Mesorhizobium sp. M0011 TaxID=2956839 RepID=UPI00333C3E80